MNVELAFSTGRVWKEYLGVWTEGVDLTLPERMYFYI